MTRPAPSSTATPLTEQEDRVLVVLAGQPNDPSYPKSTQDGSALMETVEKFAKLSKESHRRGHFPNVNMGVFYGLGRTRPSFLMNGKNGEIIQRLLVDSPAFQRISKFMNGELHLHLSLHTMMTEVKGPFGCGRQNSINTTAKTSKNSTRTTLSWGPRLKALHGLALVSTLVAKSAASSIVTSSTVHLAFVPSQHLGTLILIKGASSFSGRQSLSFGFLRDPLSSYPRPLSRIQTSLCLRVKRGIHLHNFVQAHFSDGPTMASKQKTV